MARATLSQDGVRRVDLRVPHRLGLADLIGALVNNTAPYWGVEYPPDFTSQAKAAKAIQDALRKNGTEIDGWSDEMDAEECDRWAAWACRQVLLAHPGLAPEADA